MWQFAVQAPNHPARICLTQFAPVTYFQPKPPRSASYGIHTGIQTDPRHTSPFSQPPSHVSRKKSSPQYFYYMGDSENAYGLEKTSSPSRDRRFWGRALASPQAYASVVPSSYAPDAMLTPQTNMRAPQCRHESATIEALIGPVGRQCVCPNIGGYNVSQSVSYVPRGA